MIATLAHKELRQHWPAFLSLALVTFGAMGIVGTAAQFRGLAGSIFDGLRMILYTLVPLAGFVLSHRLVALEFREKTQLFLEALPVSRWQMVVLKYFFGLAVIVFLAAGALAISAFFGRSTELLTPRFLAILAARSLVWTWFCYSLLFLFGFLGRYRFVLALAIFFGGLAIDSLTGIRLGEWGPFALIDGRFAYENTVFPVAALRITALLALGFTGLSLLLGLAREGSVAALLGEEMSHREKIFCAGLVLGGTALLGTALEPVKKAAYDLPGAIEEARTGVVVKVVAEQKARGTVLAAHVADELAALREYLGVAELPPVFILERPAFRAAQFERVHLEKEQGVLVGANFAAPDFSGRAFLPWLYREVLKARSFERAEREPSKWVLDGFAILFADRARAVRSLDANPIAAAAARRGARTGLTAEDLERWLTFEKRAGEREARFVAWVGLRTLAYRHGEDACRDFVRAVLGREVPHDARAVWRDLRDPVSRRLERAAGVSLEQFVAEWREEIGG